MTILSDRGRPGSNHSFICSNFGMQGSGKCISESIYLNTLNRGSIKFKDLKNDDLVLDEKGVGKKIKSISRSMRKCLKVSFDSELPVDCSLDHKFLTTRGLLKASDLVVGDLIFTARRRIDRTGDQSDLEKGMFYGAYIADGTGRISQKWIKAKRKDGLRKNGNHIDIMISNDNLQYLEKLKYIADKHFNFTSVNIRKASVGRYVLCIYGIDEVSKFLDDCGCNSNEKKIPEIVFSSRRFAFGFISGYSSGDLTCNMVKSRRGTYKTEVGYLIKNELAGAQILELLHCSGFWPNVSERILRSGKWKGNKYIRITFPAKEVNRFLNGMYIFNSGKKKRVDLVLSGRKNRKSDDLKSNDCKMMFLHGNRLAKVKSLYNIGIKKCVDININSKTHLFQLTGGLLTHNSWAAIALAAILDPNFSIDNIYFDYRDLVYNRKNLKPGTAVIVDEQSEEYGVDSNRINIILGALKEQLRKKSIHFVFCAPVLKEESKTSMYILETMYIDYQERCCYAALMTREMLTLGYVRIPTPLEFVTKEFMEAYEAKKDAHLDKVTGSKQDDEVEELAEKITSNELFITAENFYVKKVGYMPASMVMQVINKLYPEFKSSVIVGEVGARIKLNKELEGRWKIPYAEKKKK